MKSQELAQDIGVGLLAGLVATKVTEYAQQGLWSLTPEQVRQQEQRVRPGPPYQLAARKTARVLDVDLDEDQMTRAGMAMHYGSGVLWGSVYCLMRRAAGMESVGAGVAAGTSMSIILDELVTPALGLSAPNREYPAATHLRGFFGHLVYGAALATAAEALYGLASRSANRGHDRGRHD